MTGVPQGTLPLVVTLVVADFALLAVDAYLYWEIYGAGVVDAWVLGCAVTFGILWYWTTGEN